MDGFGQPHDVKKIVKLGTLRNTFLVFRNTPVNNILKTRELNSLFYLTHFVKENFFHCALQVAWIIPTVNKFISTAAVVLHVAVSKKLYTLEKDEI